MSEEIEVKTKKVNVKKAGRPKGVRNLLTESKREELYKLAVRNGYTPIVKWVDDIRDLNTKIREQEESEECNYPYLAQLLRLRFDIEREINSYFLPKLKPKSSDEGEKKSGDIVVKLTDPFARLREKSEVVDV